MAAIFICYGLQSIRCETTDFTNLNILILKALFSVPRFIFGHFEGSDDIFHQKICISKLNRCEIAILVVVLVLETGLVI